MWSTWLPILALTTLAVACASHISLKAFTILFLTMTLGTLASFEMLLAFNFIIKSISSTFKNLADGFFSFLLELVVVLTCEFGSFVLVALTFGTTSSFVSKAFTVQFQTFCILAFTAEALRNTSGLDSCEESSLIDCRIDHILGKCVELLFFLLNLLLLVML